MAAGELSHLQQALAASKIPIHIHLSWNPIERRPDKSARYWSTQIDNTGVLIYLNLRRRKCAIIPSASLSTQINPIVWKKILHSLTEDLQCTHHENALSLMVETINQSLTQSRNTN